jgi:hypothetical protein
LDYRHEGGVRAERTETFLPNESIVPQTDEFAANGIFNRQIGSVSTSLNARLELERRQASLAPPGLLGPIRRGRERVGGRGGLTLNGDSGTWRWSLIGNLESSELVNSDRESSFAAGWFQRATTSRTSADASLLVNGSLFSLPAGRVQVAAEAGGTAGRIVSQTTGPLPGPRSERARGTAHVQTSVELPIAGRGSQIAGELTLNLNARVERSSDFGTHLGFGYGLRWSPAPILNVAVSVSRAEQAPRLEQLAEALLLTPKGRGFDFTRGETVPLLFLGGGNLELRPEKRRLMNLRIQLQPPQAQGLSATLEYSRSRLRDATVEMLGPTSQVEAAFPERFERSGEGRLLQFDERPATFVLIRRQQVRWGINLSKPFGSPRARSEARLAQSTAVPDNDMRPRRRGQVSFALYHTWHLQNQVLIRQGGRLLDLLAGDAIGNRGGEPRHELELQAGLSRVGHGARITAEWRSDTAVKSLTRVDGSSSPELSFSRVPAVNLRIFVDLGAQPWLTGLPWLRGRLNLTIDDLFNSRTSVRDAGGTIPAAFNRSYADPVGRSFRITLRKNFRSR